MPKEYKLKGLMELLRLKEKQDAASGAPVDWAFEATKEYVQEFFKQPLRGGDSGESDRAGCEGERNSLDGVSNELGVSGHPRGVTSADHDRSEVQPENKAEGHGLEGLP